MRETTRPLGVVYTPRDVAAAMVELVLAPLVEGKRAEEILALRVCDPAIGEGVFLVEVVRVLADALGAAWIREGAEGRASADDVRADRARAVAPTTDLDDLDDLTRVARARVAERCIIGVDIDVRAVETARAVLGTSTEALRVADALSLDWSAAFPEVFARGGFDVVVGNPPYIRQERLAAKLALRAYASYHGVADLYVYFIELAHRVLRPRGRFCLIVPNKWLTVAYARGLRGFLAAQASVEGVVDLSRAQLFADADAFPCIVWGTVGTENAAPILAMKAPASVPVARALREGTRPHVRERWGVEPWHIEASSESALLQRIEQPWPRLAEVVPGRASRGVVTGCNRAFVIDRATRDQLLEREARAASIIRPFVKGRDVKGWRVEQAERWILLIDRGTVIEELPAVHAHLAQFRPALEPKPAGWAEAWSGRKPGTYAWYELQDPVGPLVKARAPRLLFQDIQTAPACALDETGALVPDTTVWMLPTDDRVVLALLNSPLYGWYARRRFPPALNGALRPKLEYMRTLPIAQPSQGARREIEALVDRRIALADRPPSEEDARPRQELDAAIAHAIFELYGLSVAERRVIDEG